MLIVCDNFKGKKILSFKKTSGTFINEKQICSATSRCVIICYVTYRLQIIKSNCINMCRYFILFFRMLNNVILKVAILNSELTVLTYDIYI